MSVIPMPRTVRLGALMVALAVSLSFSKQISPEKREARRVAHMKKELDLTADQVAKIRAILASNRPEMSEVSDEAGEGRDAMGPHPVMKHGEGPFGDPGFAEQMRADVVDTAALNRAFVARAEAMRERGLAMHARRVATFTAIHGVLTPEQRAKAAANMDARRAKMEERAGRK